MTEVPVSMNYAEMAAQIGKTENWVKRNARRMPHHRVGQTYTFTEEDLAEYRKQTEVRPEPAKPAESEGMRPIGRRRRT